MVLKCVDALYPPHSKVQQAYAAIGAHSDNPVGAAILADARGLDIPDCPLTTRVRVHAQRA
eukprot:scaffold4277_cov405-Prasinococcus_capsulatus_cf.AAC.6